MTIAIGGMKKDVMENAIKKADSSINTIVTTDMGAIPLLKNSEADYYCGACESGAGAAISLLIGMIGYSKCCTIAKIGQKVSVEDVEKHVASGKIAFGMANDTIETTVPLLVEILLKKE